MGCSWAAHGLPQSMASMARRIDGVFLMTRWQETLNARNLASFLPKNARAGVKPSMSINVDGRNFFSPH